MKPERIEIGRCFVSEPRGLILKVLRTIEGISDETYYQFTFYDLVTGEAYPNSMYETEKGLSVWADRLTVEYPDFIRTLVRPLVRQVRTYGPGIV